MHGGADAQLQPCLAHSAHGPGYEGQRRLVPARAGLRVRQGIRGRAGRCWDPRILLLHQHSGFLLGLCDHPGRSGDAFDPRRTGLDHIAFEVADRAELTSWMAHLDELGVAHSPVRELGHSCFVPLEDPDRVQIELWLTITPRRPAASR